MLVLVFCTFFVQLAAGFGCRSPIFLCNTLSCAEKVYTDKYIMCSSPGVLPPHFQNEKTRILRQGHTAYRGVIQ